MGEKITDINAYRDKKEKADEIHNLKERYLENARKIEEAETFLDYLLDKYDLSYDSVGDDMPDKIVEMENEIEDLQKGLHTPDKIKRLQADIKQAENDLEEWKKVYPVYEESLHAMFASYKELFRVLERNEFKNFLTDIDFEHEDADAEIKRMEEEKIEDEQRQNEYEQRLIDEGYGTDEDHDG